MTPVKILIVEDEFLIVENLIAKLYKNGYLVCGVAATGETAIEKAQMEEPDIVLMDIILRGEMDGIDTAEKIRQHLDLPVIYLTANYSRDIIERAKLTEPFGFLMKPFNDRELLAAIEMALHKNRIEKELKSREKRLRTVVDHTSEWDFWITPDCRFKYNSPSCKKISGHAPEDFEREPEIFFKTVHPRDAQRVKACFTVSGEKADPFEQVYRIGSKTGREKWIRQTCTPIFSKSGRWRGFVGTNRDISEQMELRQKELLEKKLEVMSLFVEGISHDFNNLLSVILGNIDLAQDYMDPSDSVFELLKDARKACFQARKLTGQYAFLSSSPGIYMQDNDLAALVKSIVSEMEHPENIRFDFFFPDDFSRVQIDPRLLSMALGAVIENALEAMPDGGVVTFKGEKMIIDSQNFRDGGYYLADGMYARLSIADTGRGMTAKVLDRAFDPYFSTKCRGIQKGMGLGLAIAMGAVKKQSGHIQIKSDPGMGTTVEIYIPSN